jgi:hypothetical protein
MLKKARDLGQLNEKDDVGLKQTFIKIYYYLNFCKTILQKRELDDYNLNRFKNTYNNS